MDPKTPQHLYRWFDAEGNLLYVGISVNAFERASSHRKYSEWFSEAKTMTLQVYPTREEALQAETEAIRDEAPKYNIAQVSALSSDVREARAKKQAAIAAKREAKQWKESMYSFEVMREGRFYQNTGISFSDLPEEVREAIVEGFTLTRPVVQVTSQKLYRALELEDFALSGIKKKIKAVSESPRCEVCGK